MRHISHFSGGVHPKENKNTHFQQPKQLNDFKTVRIPMSMHVGPPCSCVVQKGDSVKIGQVIGESTGALAVPIHASISGTVTSVVKEVASSGRSVEIVVIESDGQMLLDETLSPPVVTDKASFIGALKASGLVGLGGAGFPTHMKMQPPAGKEPDVLVINAAECEPYISVDFRQCVEHPDEIIEGIRHVMTYMSIPKALIGIETNKPKAIEALREEIKKRKETAIEVIPLKTRYPQGAEKMLIYALTGRSVPTGGLPHDVHTLVLNVTTVRYIAVYLKTGMPLVRKTLTIDGSAVKNPMNVDVPIGATIPDVIEATGGLVSDPGKVIMGGPMMGVALDRLEASIIKQNNAILVFDEADGSTPIETPCIRCGRCVSVCPMRLMPTTLDESVRNRDVADLNQHHILDCIECGSCNYSCPAKRYLVQSIRDGKIMVRAAKAKEASQS